MRPDEGFVADPQDGGSRTPGEPEAGRPYESSSVAGAILLTAFAPFVALVAALVLHGSERDPARRRQLATWAAVSGAYLAVGLLVVLALYSSFAVRARTDTKGPCVGGPEIGAAAEPLGDGRYRVPCAISGSQIVYFDEGPTPSP